MSLISPKFDVKSIIFSQFWPGAFPKIAGKSPDFLFLISSKILIIKAGIPKILVRIANREDPDQTASEEAV